MSGRLINKISSFFRQEMVVHILRRLLLLIPVLIGTSIVVFALIHMIPGDPAIAFIGEHATPDAVKKIREKYGLDQPLPLQYIRWLQLAVTGDLGKSLTTGDTVVNEIKARFPATLELSIAAMLIATLIGIFAGVVSAVKRYSIFDYVVMLGSLFGVSMPVFWLGLMLMVIFGVSLDILPLTGRLDPAISFKSQTGLIILESFCTGNFKVFLNAVAHIILPSITLATVPLATIARISRSSMIEVMTQDYIRTARSKGLSEFRVISKHALKNAMIPTVTVVGLNFGLLLGGAVLTETVFSWPGLGKFLFVSITSRDYPVIMGCILFFVILFVIVNLIVDILYAFLDPKIRYK